MKTATAFFSKNYWCYMFSISKAVRSLLSAFGCMWLIIEVLSFFFTNLGITIKSLWVWFIIIGISWTIWDNRPTLSITHSLNGRDVKIQVCIGDIFDFTGAFIVGSNTTFDTEIGNGIISPKSIQGQFTQKFYKNIKHLDNDLNDKLKNETIQRIDSKKKGKDKVYDIGTIINLNISPIDAYFVAMAHMNEHGNASASFEDLQNCLVKLWDYIATRGGIEPIITPILGTGFGRIESTRIDIIKEIIRSFVAACSTKRFTEKLVIVIHPNDFIKFDINLNELNDFLRYECKFVQFKSNKDFGGGIAISS